MSVLNTNDILNGSEERGPGKGNNKHDTETHLNYHFYVFCKCSVNPFYNVILFINLLFDEISHFEEILVCFDFFLS